MGNTILEKRRIKELIGYVAEDAQGAIDNVKMVKKLVEDFDDIPSAAQWWSLRAMVMSGLDQAIDLLKSSISGYIEPVIDRIELVEGGAHE